MTQVDTPPPVTLAAAPNGGRHSPDDHPALPVGIPALAEAASACVAAGAAMLHVHVRDGQGAHVLDAGLYAEATAAIRAATGPDPVVQVTSEALGRYDPAAQRALLRTVRAEAASLALRELAPEAADEAALSRLLGDMLDAGCVPQVILYDTADLSRLRALRDTGRLPVRDLPVLVPLGRYAGGGVGRPQDLLALLGQGLAEFGHWSTCAFGPHEARCVATAACLGGHGRVGFENNLHLPNGRLAPDNAALVAATAGGLRALGLSLQDGPGLRRDWARVLAA